MSDLLRDGQALFSREQYRALLEVAEAIAVHRDLSELFQDLAQRLPRIVPFEWQRVFRLVLLAPTLMPRRAVATRVATHPMPAPRR